MHNKSKIRTSHILFNMSSGYINLLEMLKKRNTWVTNHFLGVLDHSMLDFFHGNESLVLSF